VIASADLGHAKTAVDYLIDRNVPSVTGKLSGITRSGVEARVGSFVRSSTIYYVGSSSPAVSVPSR
jgi:hypothetical protein